MNVRCKYLREKLGLCLKLWIALPIKCCALGSVCMQLLPFYQDGEVDYGFEPISMGSSRIYP